MKLNFMEAYSSRDESLAKVTSAHVLFHFSLSHTLLYTITRQAYLRNCPLFPQQSGDSPGCSTCLRARKPIVHSAPSPSSSGHFHPPIEFGSSVLSLVHTDTHPEQFLFLIRNSQGRSQDSLLSRVFGKRATASKQALRRNISGGKGDRDVLLMSYEGGQSCFTSLFASSIKIDTTGKAGRRILQPERVLGGGLLLQVGPDCGWSFNWYRSDPARKRRVDLGKSCRWSDSASERVRSRQCFCSQHAVSLHFQKKQTLHSKQGFFQPHRLLSIFPLAATSLTISTISPFPTHQHLQPRGSPTIATPRRRLMTSFLSLPCILPSPQTKTFTPKSSTMA